MLKESRNLHREDTVRNIKAKLRLSGQTRPAGIHHHQAGTRNIKKELFRLKDMIDPGCLDLGRGNDPASDLLPQLAAKHLAGLEKGEDSFSVSSESLPNSD